MFMQKTFDFIALKWYYNVKYVIDRGASFMSKRQ